MYFNQEEVGQRVRDLRKSRGMTAEKLSEELDYSHSHVSNAESGLRCYSIDLLICISRYFDVSLDYLILGRRKEKEREIEQTKRSMRLLLEELNTMVNDL